MADNSPPLEDSNVTTLLDSPASNAEEETDPLTVSPAAASDQDIVPTTPGRSMAKDIENRLDGCSTPGRMSRTGVMEGRAGL